MIRRRSTAPARDPRLDPYRNRAAALTDEAGRERRMYVESAQVTSSDGDPWWWTPWGRPQEWPVIHLERTDGKWDVWEVFPDFVEAQLADWASGRFDDGDDVFQVAWLDDAASRSLRAVLDLDADDGTRRAPWFGRGPRRPSPQPARNPRLDPYRNRAAAFSDESGRRRGRFYVESDEERTALSGHLWWTRWSLPQEFVILWIETTDGDSTDVWVTPDLLDAELHQWDARRFRFGDDTFNLIWLDDADAEELRRRFGC